MGPRPQITFSARSSIGFIILTYFFVYYLRYDRRVRNTVLPKHYLKHEVREKPTLESLEESKLTYCNIRNLKWLARLGLNHRALPCQRCTPRKCNAWILIGKLNKYWELTILLITADYGLLRCFLVGDVTQMLHKIPTV